MTLLCQNSGVTWSVGMRVSLAALFTRTCNSIMLGQDGTGCFSKLGDVCEVTVMVCDLDGGGGGGLGAQSLD